MAYRVDRITLHFITAPSRIHAAVKRYEKPRSSATCQPFGTVVHGGRGIVIVIKSITCLLASIRHTDLSVTNLTTPITYYSRHLLAAGPAPIASK
jgi:hypothetical protein